MLALVRGKKTRRSTSGGENFPNRVKGKTNNFFHSLSCLLSFVSSTTSLPWVARPRKFLFNFCHLLTLPSDTCSRHALQCENFYHIFLFLKYVFFIFLWYDVDFENEKENLRHFFKYRLTCLQFFIVSKWCK